MEWIDQAKLLRQGGMRVLQIAEILGLPPGKVKDAIKPPPPPAPPPPAPVIETSYAPAPLPMRPKLPRRKTMERIDAICAEYGVTFEDIASPSRIPKYTKPRFLVCRMLREEMGWSLPRIGRLLGGRDHTTILSAVRRAREMQP